jgi:hypothetical protein
LTGFLIWLKYNTVQNIPIVRVVKHDFAFKQGFQSGLRLAFNHESRIQRVIELEVCHDNLFQKFLLFGEVLLAAFVIKSKEAVSKGYYAAHVVRH